MKSSKLLKMVIKLLFVGFVLYFLAQKGLLSFEKTGKAFSRLDKLLPAVVLLVTCTMLSLVRWQFLIRAQGIHLGWLKVFSLGFIGLFFNIALPGAVSGDFVKAFYIGREAPGMRAKAFGSILFDRLAGLSALGLVSAGALLIHYSAFVGTPLFKGIQAFVIVSGISVIIFYAYLFLVHEDHDPVLGVFRWLETKSAKSSSLTRIYLGVRHYHHHRLAVLGALTLSLMIHITVCTACVLLAQSLGEASLDALPVFIVVPLGMLVTAIPVLPAGVGTGHAAFGALFHLLGSERGADVFSLLVLTNLLTSAVGGLVYLRFRSHEPRPDLA